MGVVTVGVVTVGVVTGLVNNLAKGVGDEIKEYSFSCTLSSFSSSCLSLSLSLRSFKKSKYNYYNRSTKQISVCYL